MFDLQGFGASPHSSPRRRRLARTEPKPAVEQLERRELLDSGLAAGLTSAAASRLLTGLYNDLLNRAPQPVELAGRQSAVNAGQSLQALARAFLSSPEFQTDFITDSYATLLKRQAQPLEVNGWLQATQAGLSEERLTAQFLASDEYYQEHGGTAEGWLTGLYWDLFQRTPDAAGFFLWRDGLQNGTTRETVALGFVTSPEANTRFVTASYQQLLDRTPDAGGEAAWVAALDAGLARSELTAGIIGSPEYALIHSAASSNLPGNPAANGSPVQFDFGPAWSAAPQGGTGVSLVLYSPQRGYGWDSLTGLVVQDRGGIAGRDSTFRIDLPNGTYTVTPTLGDSTVAHSNMAIWAQGVQEVSGLNTAAGQFLRPSFNVPVTNGQLELRFAAEGGGNTFVLDQLDIAPTAASGTPTGPSSVANDGTVAASSGTTAAAPSTTVSDSVSSSGAPSALPPTQTSPDGSAAGVTSTLPGGSINIGALTLSRALHAITVTINGSPLTSPVNVPIALTSTVSDPNAGATTAGFRYAWKVTENGSAVASATTASFTFTPQAAGTYLVSLTVTDKYNLTAVSSKTISVVKVPTPLNVTINGAAPTWPTGMHLSLTSTVTSSSQAEMAAGFGYNWSVTRDGTAFTSATTSNLIFNPNVAGTYVVTLTVTANLDKSTGTAATTITVGSPVPSLAVSAGSDVVTKEGTAVQFSGTATGGTGPYSYAWDFGDGDKASGSLTPTYTYANSGTYTVTLTVTDAQNRSSQSTLRATVQDVPPSVTINGAPSSSPVGAPIALTATVTSPSTIDTAAGFSYAWNVTQNGAAFASATTSNFSFTPTAVGTYVVTLTATAKDNATGTASQTITVVNAAADPLSVTINGAPSSSPEGAPISLTSTVTSSSAANTAAGFSYSWNVTKDGAAFASATTPSFNFTPTDRGTYVVTLVATAQDKTSGTASQTINVTDVAPLVSIAGAPTTSQTGTAISLTSNVFSPSTADMAAGFRYAWSVTSNGTAIASGSAANFSFTPSSAATYVVALTVTDKDGATGSASTTITVTAPTLPPPLPSPPPGAFITTPYEKIPNFGANPNIVSATSGAWSSTSTWSSGTLPGAGDVVSITANTTVTYDLVSDAAINTVIVQSGGHLIFRTDISTRLTVVNLIVLEGGELQIGTASNPVSPTVKAEVVFANQPLNTAIDPAQYGNGLIGLGTVTMYGAAKTQTFVKLAAEPKAGATTLTLSQPVTGWQAGDKVLLPDTRQLVRGNQTDGNYVSQIETPVLASVSSDGLTLTLKSPLQFDHLGARDGNGALTFLPYVGNLSRNVMIRSQSITGTRGHVTFTYHANVDVRYVGFYGLGRTTDAQPDDTTFDANGNVTKIGTNQSGRYPVYIEHLIGPATRPSDGYQYTLLGDVVFCVLEPMLYRWGIAINDSHYGLLQDNIVDNWQGAGIITVSGNESFNVIAHNYVADIQSPSGAPSVNWWRADSRGLQDEGFEGVGFWFRGFNNYVRDNVAADAGSYGYTYFAQYLGSVNVPLAPGDDTSTAGQYQTINMNATPILEFSGNEAFGATPSGMTIWWLATVWHTPQDQTPESFIKDFHVWHMHDQGFFAYEMNKVTFDGFVVRGDFGLLAQGQAQAGLQGFGANDYFVKDLLIENSDIQGMWEGFDPSTESGGGIQTIQNSYLQNYYNVYLDHLWTSSYRSDTVSPRVTNVRNVRFATPNVPDTSGPKANIFMQDFLNNDVVNLIQSDQLFVYDYNGVVGDDFQVYYLAQSPSFVVPQSTYNADGTPRLDASPQAGLTNQQLWALNRIAIAGAVAPTSATRAGIQGYVRAF